MIIGNISKIRKIVLILLTGLLLQSAAANNIVLQVGAFNASQGTVQDIGINGLIGDQFTLNRHFDQNILFGIGYYFDGLNKEKYTLMYGIDAFYLAPTTVQGDVIQEHMFDNLSYRYKITNIPIYLSTKAFITMNTKYDITLDLGAGPNIISTSNFSESSLDNGVTIPDNKAFSGTITLAPSITAGIGCKINDVFNHMPLEIDYRFFYLGQGRLNKANDQFLGDLKTGNNYANALMISTSF